MSEKMFLDWEEALAAVKLNGVWRFFSDREAMFLLDYTAYDDEYTPLPSGFRYGTLVVDSNNVHEWIKSLSREFTIEQLSQLYWENTETRVQLTFVVDFDEQLWVGCLWKMDQSPLNEYQPSGWTAIEADVYEYLPGHIKSVWK